MDTAIIGLACKFPGANNYLEFWNNVAQSKSSISEIPPQRWDWKAYWGDPLICLISECCFIFLQHRVYMWSKKYFHQKLRYAITGQVDHE